MKTKKSAKRNRKKCAPIGFVASILESNPRRENVFYAGMPDPRQRKHKAPKMRVKERFASAARMERL